MKFNQRELNYLINLLDDHYENRDFKVNYITELNRQLCKKLYKQRSSQKIDEKFLNMEKKHETN